MARFIEQLGLNAQQLTIVSSVCLALGVWFLARFVLSIMHADRHDKLLGYVELRRRQQIRQANPTYRNFEPAIVALSERFATRSASGLAKVRAFEAASQILPDFPPWKLDEYATAQFLIGLLIGAAAAIFAGFIFGLPLGLVLLLIVPPVVAQAQVGSVREQTRRRIAQLKRRLPFAVDLMALTMESGAGFLQALRTVVAETGGHPLGDELGKVVSRVDQGELQSVALDEFQRRIADEDVRQLVDAINQGEQLGTPLAQILRQQSDVMRLKTSQWVERAAKEAEVRMTGPGFVMALACMVIVAAPFILKAVDIF